MRCEQARDILIENPAAAPVREHLGQCPACQSFAKDLDLLQGGFQALAVAPIPEPSIGFSTRVLRRLVESPVPNPADFFETIGRRVVCAASLVALIFLMALALPTSGPFRGPTAAEFTLARPEAGSISNPVFDDGQIASQDLNPLPAVQNGATSEP